DRHSRDLGPAGAVPPGADGAGRASLPDAEVPHDGAERRGADRSAVGDARRSAPHPDRHLPAAHESGRAAAADQRAARRHEPGGPAARATELRRGVPAPGAGLHAASQDEGGHHRLGADQRLARQHLDREAHRVRSGLHRALVASLRPDHPAQDSVARVSQPERVLTDAAPADAGRRWLLAARTPLLVLLVLGLVSSISLTQVTLALLAVWLGLARRAGIVARLRLPLAVPLVLFVAWTVVAALASDDPRDSLATCKNLLNLVGLWIVASTLEDARAARRFLAGLALALGVVAV